MYDPNMAGHNVLTMQIFGHLSAMNNQDLGTIKNGAFTYSGSAMNLESRIDTLQGTAISSASISVLGSQVKESDATCYYCTVGFGSFLFFPLCFTCCGWWKKKVGALFAIPISTYQRIAGFIEQHGMSTLTLNIFDCNFNKQKVQILYEALSRSKLKGFTLINLSSTNDFNENEYSDFKENVKILKSLPIMTDLRWMDEVAM